MDNFTNFQTSVGFIGAGNMGGAVARGLAASVDCGIYLYDKDKAKAEALAAITDAEVAASASELVRECKYVFLAVKPQQLASLLAEIKPSLSDETVFVSVCAGIDFAFIAQNIDAGSSDCVKVVRAMPNMAAARGLSATAICRNWSVTDEEFAFAKQIFGSCGRTIEISPDKMNAVIPLNGSSPAFIYRFAEGLLDYAQENGFTGETALLLLSQSLRGAAEMLEHGGVPVAELIHQVSSPGGTTIAGLAAGETLRETVKNMCTACKKRADELSR